MRPAVVVHSHCLSLNVTIPQCACYFNALPLPPLPSPSLPLQRSIDKGRNASEVSRIDGGRLFEREREREREREKERERERERERDPIDESEFSLFTVLYIDRGDLARERKETRFSSSALSVGSRSHSEENQVNHTPSTQSPTCLVLVPFAVVSTREPRISERFEVSAFVVISRRVL